MGKLFNLSLGKYKKLVLLLMAFLSMILIFPSIEELLIYCQLSRLDFAKIMEVEAYEVYDLNIMKIDDKEEIIERLMGLADENNLSFGFRDYEGDGENSYQFYFYTNGERIVKSLPISPQMSLEEFQALEEPLTNTSEAKTHSLDILPSK